MAAVSVKRSIVCMLFLRPEVVTNFVDRPLFPNAVTLMRKLSQKT